MKKLLSVFITLTIFLATLTAVVSADDITVLLDGGRLEFDVQPRIINDRAMVPMRVIFEALGAEVLWDDTTKTIMSEKDGTDIVMTIGYDAMFVNYEPVTLDSPPVIVGDRTLVPLRAVAESFDCDVDWDADTRTVTISTAAQATEAPQQTVTPSSSPSAGNSSASSTEKTSGDSKATATVAPKSTSVPDAAANPEFTEAPEFTSSPETTPDPDATVTPETTQAPQSDSDSSAAASTPQPTVKPAMTTSELEELIDADLRFDAIINYDSANERESSSVKNFRITSVILNSSGNYDITYVLQTYNDSTGKVIPKFRCYDYEGKLVDTFTEIFQTWAYSWTDQDGAATISGDTILIELSNQ